MRSYAVDEVSLHVGGYKLAWGQLLYSTKPVRLSLRESDL